MSSPLEFFVYFQFIGLRWFGYLQEVTKEIFTFIFVHPVDERRGTYRQRSFMSDCAWKCVKQMCSGKNAQRSSSTSCRFSSRASALQNWEEFYGKSQGEVSHQVWPCMERSWADRVCVAEAPAYNQSQAWSFPIPHRLASLTVGDIPVGKK